MTQAIKRLKATAAGKKGADDNDLKNFLYDLSNQLGDVETKIKKASPEMKKVMAQVAKSSSKGAALAKKFDALLANISKVVEQADVLADKYEEHINGSFDRSRGPNMRPDY
jgi:hypothetical protein